jgi:membrane protein YqaA with SNARE-associated domain
MTKSNRFYIVGAFVWSLFEATIFFVVPDVWLSYCGLRGFRVMVLSVLASVLGSAAGAVVLSLSPRR